VDAMDFITHTLMGVGAARVIAPRADLRPQVCLAGVLGSLLQDGDSWLYLIGPNYYGLYHRVASHSWVGLAGIGAAAGLLAWQMGRVARWRRFGWFVHANLDARVVPPRAQLPMLLAAGLAAAYLHWCADAITGFGNMRPFWPWSQWDASLHAVMSFDVFIFVATFGWHATTRRLNLSRKEETIFAGSYLAAIAYYVVVRVATGEPTFI